MWAGGVAKPGQTRRTQDQCTRHHFFSPHSELLDERSRPLGVRGFKSHPLHLNSAFFEACVVASGGIARRLSTARPLLTGTAYLSRDPAGNKYTRARRQSRAKVLQLGSRARRSGPAALFIDNMSISAPTEMAAAAFMVQLLQNTSF